MASFVDIFHINFSAVCIPNWQRACRLQADNYLKLFSSCLPNCANAYPSGGISLVTPETLFHAYVIFWQNWFLFFTYSVRVLHISSVRCSLWECWLLVGWSQTNVYIFDLSRFCECMLMKIWPSVHYSKRLLKFWAWVHPHHIAVTVTTLCICYFTIVGNYFHITVTVTTSPHRCIKIWNKNDC